MMSPQDTSGLGLNCHLLPKVQLPHPLLPNNNVLTLGQEIPSGNNTLIDKL